MGAECVRKRKFCPRGKGKVLPQKAVQEAVQEAVQTKNPELRKTQDSKPCLKLKSSDSPIESCYIIRVDSNEKEYALSVVDATPKVKEDRYIFFLSDSQKKLFPNETHEFSLFDNSFDNLFYHTITLGFSFTRKFCTQIPYI